MINVEKINEKCLIALQALQDIMDATKLNRFTVYLEKIDGTVCQERLLYFIKQYEKLYTNGIDLIFISNRTEEGKAHFDNLFFFSKGRCIEMKDFLSADRIRNVKLKNEVNTWNVDRENYQFKNFEGDYFSKTAAIDSSTMNLSVTLEHGQTLHFEAVKKNCDFLYQVLKDYIVENES
jgi:hypothetical protein